MVPLSSIVVYSCVTGDYDDLKEFGEFAEPGVDYYFFTNNRDLTSDFWNVVYVDNEGMDNIRLARKIKVLGHPVLKKYDVVVWLDGASVLRRPVTAFINDKCNLDKYSLVGFAHRERDSIYSEALECIKVGKDSRDVIEDQIVGYREEGYPDHDGLIESTVMVRRGHDEQLDQTMEAWFYEIEHKSYRDQLSFNYVARKTGLSFDLLSYNVFDNEYFGWSKHLVKENEYQIKDFVVIYGTDDQFDFSSYWMLPYRKDGKNKYLIEFDVHKSCSEFKVELMKHAGATWASFCVECESADTYNLVNWCNYYGINYFDGGVPTVFLYGDFSAGDHVYISFESDYPDRDTYMSLVKRLNSDFIASSERAQQLAAHDARLSVSSVMGRLADLIRRGRARS